MKAFVIFRLETGAIEATCYTDDPMVAAEQRARLQRQLGVPLHSMVETRDAAADEAHIRLTVGRYHQHQAAL